MEECVRGGLKRRLYFLILEWTSVAREALSDLGYKAETGSVCVCVNERTSKETERFFHVFRIWWGWRAARSPPLCLGLYKSLSACPNIIPIINVVSSAKSEGLCGLVALRWFVYNPPLLSYNGISTARTYTTPLVFYCPSPCVHAHAC